MKLILLYFAVFVTFLTRIVGVTAVYANTNYNNGNQNQQQPYSCFDCLSMHTCPLLAKKSGILRKLMYMELAKHSIVTQGEVDQFTVDVQEETRKPCVMSNVTYFTAFWFGFEPQPTQDCDIRMGVCKGCILSNFRNWQPFNNDAPYLIDVHKKGFQTAADALKAFIIQPFKAQVTSDVNFLRFAEAIKQAKGDECPMQRELSRKELVGMFLDSIEAYICPHHRLAMEQQEKDLRNKIITKSDSHETHLPPSNIPSDDFKNLDGKQENGTSGNSSTTIYPDGGKNDTSRNSSITINPDGGKNDTSGNSSTTIGPDSGQNGTSGNSSTAIDPDGGQNDTQSRRRRRELQSPTATVVQTVVSIFRLCSAIAEYRIEDSVLSPGNYSSNHNFEQKCGPFRDGLFVKRVTFMNYVQRAFLGCEECPDPSEITSHFNTSCKNESIEKYANDYQEKISYAIGIFRGFLKCSPFDDMCLRKESDYRTLETALELLKSLCCGRCQVIKEKDYCDNGKCNPTFELSPINKYLTIEKVLKNSMNGCPPMHEGKEQQVAGGHYIQGGEYFYRILTYLVNTKETNDNNEQLEMDCEKSTENLQRLQCSSYLTKLKVKTFFHLVKRMTPCKQEELDEKYMFCKKNPMESLSSVCPLGAATNVSKSNDTMKNITAPRIAALLFTPCQDPYSHTPFLMEIMECALYSVMIGYNGKIFGDTKSLEYMRHMFPTMLSGKDIDEEGKQMVKRLFQVKKCDKMCPYMYSYCTYSRKCLLSWLTCQSNNYDATISDKEDFKVLPRMYSNDITSYEYKISSFISSQSSGINLFNSFSKEEQLKGVWQYDYASSGHWHDVADIQHGMAVQLSSIFSRIRYKQYSLGMDYGFRMFYYSEQKYGIKPGKEVKPDSTSAFKTAILLIHPAPINATFTATDPVKNISMYEDDHYNSGIGNFEFFHTNTAFQYKQHDVIPIEYRRRIPAEELNRFYHNVEEFKNSRPVAVIKTDISHAGYLEIIVNAKEGFFRIPAKNNILPLDYEKSNITFRPLPNYNGNLTVLLEICNCLSKSENKISKTINLSITVLPVNDPPTFKSRLVFFPPIPFNITAENGNNGFTVHQLLNETNTFDPESGSDIGIAVYTLPTESLGKWQYQNQANEWIDIVIENTVNPFKQDVKTLDPESTVNAHHFHKEQRIRFALNDSSLLWPGSKGRQASFLGFSYWDKSNGLQPGLHQQIIRAMGVSNSYSSPILGVELRLGCDGKPGSLARIDECGICGGDGTKCFGCDGQKDSGAIIDECGICTGGTTNLEYNYLKKADCGNTCGKAELDDCGICQGKTLKRNFKDCDGVCFGNAEINLCDICTGGNTTKTSSEGFDACGVCHGDDTSCQGCDRIANSGKNNDSCGNCLLKIDPDFDSTCFALTSMFPSSARAQGGDSVIVNSAGFDKDETYCFLEDQRYRYELLNLKRIDQSSFLFTTPTNMSPGMYALKCSYRDNEYRVEGFEVYDLVVNEVIPARVENNKATSIAIKGTGFMDTGEIYCVMYIKHVVAIKGAFVNSSTVTCDLPKIPTSRKLTIFVSFSKDNKWSKKIIERLPSVVLEVYAPAPMLIKAKMSKNYRKISMNLTRPASFARGKSCQNIFSESTVEKLGKRFRCGFKDATTLVIRLGSKSTIKPLLDNITVLKDSLTAWKQSISDLSLGTDLVIHQPDNKVIPVAVISGNKKIGICDKIRINGRKSKGALGRQLIYKWGVNFSSDVVIGMLPGDAQTKLDALKTKLSLLPSNKNTLRLNPDEISPDVQYNFTLQVENFISENSNIESLIMYQVNNILPSVFIRGGKIQTIKASRLTKIQSRGRMPKCAGAFSKLIYTWEIKETSVTLDPNSMNNAVLYIYPGTLPSGKTYTLTVVVALALDPTQVTETSVELVVVGSPLRPRIRGGKSRVVSALEDFVLDGSRSRDPDREQTSERYEWSCTDSAGFVCFVQDTDNLGLVKPLELPSTSVITISNGTLKANETYRFTMTYFKGTRNASIVVDVAVNPKQPPLVSLYKSKRATEVVGDRIKIRGLVKSKIGNIRIWLKCMEADGYAYKNVSEPGVLLTPYEVFRKRAGVHRIGIVFNKNVLDEGFTYSFRLYAESSEGVGYGDVVIDTNSAPAVGVLEIEPINGTSLETEFTLSAVEGWEDNEEDLPLSYNFGYFNENGDKEFLGASSYENILTTYLPVGSKATSRVLTVFVDVADVHGSSSMASSTVTVSLPSQMSTSLIATVANGINEAIESDDLSSLLNDLSSTLHTFTEGDSVTSNMTAVEVIEKQAVADMLLQFKENVTKSILTMMTDVKDEETQNIVLKKMGEVTEGAQQFDDLTKEQVANTVARIALGQTVASASSSSRKRRNIDEMEMPEQSELFTSVLSRKRRNTENEGNNNNSKSAEEVKVILATYSNIINPNDYGNSSMSVKNTFTGLNENLLISMCRAIVYAQSPAIASSDLVSLMVMKEQFDHVSNNSLSLPACDSSTCGNSSAHVTLGATLEDMYKTWQCGGVTCTGACVGSTAYKNDLFSTSSFDKELLSSIISYHLIDPEEHTMLKPGTLNEPVELMLPLFVQSAVANVQCQFWDTSLSSWSNTTCTPVNQTVQVIDGSKYITCSCPVIGVVSVTGDLVSSVVDDSNSSNEDPTNVPSPSKIAKIQITFQGDYDNITISHGKENVEASIRTKLLLELQIIDVWRIPSVNIRKGSIIAEFTMKPKDESVHTNAIADFEKDLEKLSNLVNNQQFSVTLGGQTLNADLISVTIEDSNTRELALEGASDLTTVYIVLGSLGGIAVIAAVIFVVVKFKFTSSSSSSVV